ncbi:hypothetical protein V491_00575 [Pseudogymnoascus sp. VKM F-3775]|nr:hypothetical protein V491_00575 [Pseudogymnoascus sp. VKM F-3775]
MQFRKIKTAKSSTNQDLVDLCEQETQCADCSIGSPICPTTEPPTTIVPPENTIAIIVDISKDGGRIKFFQNANNKFVGDVSAEDFEKLVLVPWDSGWCYYSIGSLQVSYIARK